MKKVTDYDGIIDQASYERGAKVWFRDMTGIKPSRYRCQNVRARFCAQRAKSVPGIAGGGIDARSC
ncbi:MAG: hypothetical protein WDN49_05640 [Acetobacteraceae bacterium]